MGTLSAFKKLSISSLKNYTNSGAIAKNSMKFLRYPSLSLLAWRPMVREESAENNIKAEFLTLQSSNEKDWMLILNAIPMYVSILSVSWDSLNSFFRMLRECTFNSNCEPWAKSIITCTTLGIWIVFCWLVRDLRRHANTWGRPYDLLTMFNVEFWWKASIILSRSYKNYNNINHIHLKQSEESEVSWSYPWP